MLGPLLRYVDQTAATIWVETDRPCQVEILGRQARTFEVAGHHYALVVIEGLVAGTEREYQVALDGTVRWPEPGSPFPPSVLRTVDPGRPLRLVFGSCRIAELPVPRRRRSARREREHGPDALVACALDLRGTPRERWPDLMLLIGDQVYADDVGPATRQFIEARRAPRMARRWRGRTGSSAIRQEPKASRNGRPGSGVLSTLGGNCKSGSGQRTVPSRATWYSYSAPGWRSPITTSA